jgi:hypothetical protein
LAVVNSLYGANAPCFFAAVLPEYDIKKLICSWLDSREQLVTI